MSDQNLANSPNPLHLIITGLLLGIIFFFITSDFNRDQERNRQNTQLHEYNSELTEKLIQTSKQRDSLSGLVDSLIVLDQTYTQLIKQKDRELKAVKGKFDKLTNKELEQKMEEEWQKSVK